MRLSNNYNLSPETLRQCTAVARVTTPHPAQEPAPILFVGKQVQM